MASTTTNSSHSDPETPATDQSREASPRHRRIWERRQKRPTPRAVGSSWTPPRCPNEDCTAHKDPAHDDPEGRWFWRKGVHWPLCRPRPIQRFRCRHCRRWFSISTFRADRYDKKPWHNARVMAELCSGTGLRETARMLEMSRTALQMKARKISRHCHHVQSQLAEAGAVRAQVHDGRGHRVRRGQAAATPEPRRPDRLWLVAHRRRLRRHPGAPRPPHGEDQAADQGDGSGGGPRGWTVTRPRWPR